MKQVIFWLIVTAIAVNTSCSQTGERSERSAQLSANTDRANTAVAGIAAEQVAQKNGAVREISGTSSGGGDSLGAQAPQSVLAKMPQPAVPAVQDPERKIIRNADLAIETASPSEGQRQITSIVEKLGGFVVTSESTENQGTLQSAPAARVVVIARVAATRFGEALDEIHRLPGRIIYEKVSSQDVTEEYIDLEARIRAKHALEMQFLEIMKQARKVSEAMEVQAQLAEVRTEIERLEGRRRFLEHQTSLSTITVTLNPPSPIVAATRAGVIGDLKSSVSEGLNTATAIVMGLIHFAIVMIPIVALLILPGWLLIKRLSRYLEWPKKATATPNAADQPGPSAS